MCKIYNTIGSLTFIKNRLAQNGIHDFHSINELLAFQRNYAVAREEVIAKQRAVVTEERNSLRNTVSALEDELEAETKTLQQKAGRELNQLQKEYDALADAEKTIIQEFTYSFKALFKLIRIYRIRSTSKAAISRAIRPKVEHLAQQREQLRYLTDEFESAVKEKSWRTLLDLDKKQNVINEIKSYIYGAIGENKVVEELKQLPDDYILINDFSYTFYKPLYFKQQHTRISSIQIDHLLISPAGVFLIETKNWSKDSIQNLNLRSPVEQIQRTNYALFILLHRSGFQLGAHHWGERKIPIRNLIVLINNKPREEFQHVKVLTLNELVQHVKFAKPTLSREEMREIVEYLIGVNR
ncbi:MAG: NERD domain-containing protein [Cyclobacteriaceae bacterium]|nr:NERD domain-containing protein [Cyclobacteriaceae bacterium]